MTRRVEWPGQIRELERREWCAWFEQYGVNPRTVAVPGWAVADDDAHTLTYLAYARDGDGRITVRRGRPVTEPLTVQLVDAPAPFPTTRWRP